MAARSRNVFITGGAWWGKTSPDNLGHQTLITLACHHLKHLEPEPKHLKLYLGTRSPPSGTILQDWLRKHLQETLPHAENALIDNVSVSSASGTLLPSASLYLGEKQVLSITQIPLDLLSPASVHSCAGAFLSVENTLDTLILNAAVMPTSHKLYPIPGGEQFEQSFLTAVMGHALLVNELETAFLNSSAKNDGEIPKIVLVSSDLHRKVKGLDVSPTNLDNLLAADGYHYQKTYNIIKCIQTIYLYGLHDRYKGRVDTLAVCPGFIPSTSLSRQLPYILRLIGIPIMKLMPFVTTPAESGRKIARCAGYGTLEVSEDDLFVRDNKGAQPGKEVLDLDLRRAWMAYIDGKVNDIEERIRQEEGAL